MRGLIAEDSAMGRLLLQRAVEALGHECLVATAGLSAWETFERELPDVVISDWMMPGLEGPELCRRVRARPDTPYSYFVLLTVLREKGTRRSGCGLVQTTFWRSRSTRSTGKSA